MSIWWTQLISGRKAPNISQALGAGNGTARWCRLICTPSRNVASRRRRWAIKARSRRRGSPRTRLGRRGRHHSISRRIGPTVAPSPPISDSRAGILRISSVGACDSSAGSSRGRWSSGRRAAIEGFPAPGGQEVDAALVVEAGVRGEVGFDGGVIVAGALKLVAGGIDGAC